MNITFNRHNISSADISAANQAMRSLFITTGPITALFERDLSRFLGNQYSLGVSSCTAGMHLALAAAGINKGDEVILPPLTFVSTANVIEYTGAKPVFADVDPETGLIDPEEIRKKMTKRTKALIPVHLYGQMADMRSIRKLADKYGLFVLEDAAHCPDAERDGIRPGNLGDVAAFSYYATKNITCGEGGAVSTNDKKLFEKMAILRLHGMTHDALNRYRAGTFRQYDVPELGFKYNMTDIQAALLIGQLKRLPANTRRREEICRVYEKTVDQIPEAGYPLMKYGRTSRHLFTLWVPQSKRDKVIQGLNSHGIPVSVHFHPVHLMTYYRKKYGFKKGMFPVAERIGFSNITLPLYPQIKKTEMAYITRVLKTVLTKVL